MAQLLHPPKGDCEERECSHKYAEFCHALQAGRGHSGGNLVWIQGPYPAGKYTDIKIFYKVLVQADKGYCGHMDSEMPRERPTNSAEKQAMQARVRTCHKTLNGRLKTWGIFSRVFRHNILPRGGDVFRVCSVVTQLTMENGEPLFEVE
jgi:hypothetical protein